MDVFISSKNILKHNYHSIEQQEAEEFNNWFYDAFEILPSS